MLLGARHAGTRRFSSADATIVGEHAEPEGPQALGDLNTVPRSRNEFAVSRAIDYRAARLDRKQRQREPRFTELPLDLVEVLVPPLPELDSVEPGFRAGPYAIFNDRLLGCEQRFDAPRQSHVRLPTTFVDVVSRTRGAFLSTSGLRRPGGA